MATQPVENEVLSLEKKFWQALKDGDVDAAVRMTDFPCIITGPQGVGRVDQQAFETMMKDSPYTIRTFELDDDMQVRLLGDDVAVVAYKVREELTVEGEPVTIEAADSSTWIRRDGRWRCALHTEAIVGDPFGRDRRPSA
jgi:hypothetical protein